MASVGTGFTATFGTSAFSCEILDIDWSGISRATFDTTHMGTTTARTKGAGTLYEGGTITLNIAHDGSLTPPVISQTAAETLTITGPSEDATNASSTWAASVINTEYQWGAQLEDRQTATLTCEVTGAITITA